MNRDLILLEQFTRPHRKNFSSNDGKVISLLSGDAFSSAVGSILDHTGNRYIISEQDKKNGKKRIIEAPIDDLNVPLRQVQKIIHNTLSPLDNGKSSYGFRSYQSAYTGLVKMLSQMENNKTPDGIVSMYSLDIKNFFPSVNEEMIRNELNILFNRLLINNKKGPNISKKDSEQLIDIIIQLCTYEGRLPQGAPSSPTLANIVANKIDARIRYALEDKMGLKNNTIYGRYADDLVFMSSIHLAQSQRKIMRQIINDFGFDLSHEKSLYEKNKGSYHVWGVEVINGNNEYDQLFTFRITPERDQQYAANILEISNKIQIGEISEKNELSNALHRVLGILGFSYHISLLGDGRRIIQKIKEGKKTHFLSNKCEHAWKIFLNNHEKLLHMNSRQWFTGADIFKEGNKKTEIYDDFKLKIQNGAFRGVMDFSGFNK